jgi:hypothetical protein
MLIRDQLGYVHQVPDPPNYGFQHVGYDGLGNPVGLPILPLLTSLAPMVGDILGNLFGGKKGGGEAPPPSPPPPSEPPAFMPPAPPMAPCPPCPVCPVCGAPAEEMLPMPGVPTMPLMMAPGGMSFMRVRPRRRFHARAR